MIRRTSDRLLDAFARWAANWLDTTFKVILPVLLVLTYSLCFGAVGVADSAAKHAREQCAQALASG